MKLMENLNNAESVNNKVESAVMKAEREAAERIARVLDDRGYFD